MFDIKFTRFITNTWISIIWIILIAAHFLAYFVTVVGVMFGMDVMSGVLALIFAPIPLALSLLLCRMWLELTIVLFRIESNTRKD